MDREAQIELLVANEVIPFDRDVLTGMTDDQIAHLATNLDTQELIVEEPVVEEPVVADLAIEDEPETNSLTAEVADALNALGADGIQQVVNASQQIAEERKSERDTLVSKLVANTKVTMDEATLRRMDLEGLQGVARMVGDVSYAGAGGPVGNSEQSESSGPPPAPSIVLGDSE